MTNEDARLEYAALIQAGKRHFGLNAARELIARVKPIREQRWDARMNEQVESKTVEAERRVLAMTLAHEIDAEFGDLLAAAD